MKTQHFHGSSHSIDDLIAKGSCVSSDKGNALRFARFAHGHTDGDCYIYVLMLDPTIDLEQSRDAVGTVDKVLVRDTPFSERILVTDDVIAECRAASQADRLRER
ncbi:MAG TPA: hypothetical protein VGO67_14820 [Verrucomicrobiae bacterium]|jgi:hypothetical protein